MARPRKHPPQRSESERVSAWRKRLMQDQHYKSISFLASPDEYALIESARARYGLSTKDLMLYPLAHRPWPILESAEGPIEDDFLPETRVADPAIALEAARARGELFQLSGQQPYVLAALYLNLSLLPNLFPFDLSLIRDFTSLREALQYVCLRQDRFAPAQQIVLLTRASAEELGHAPPQPDWYALRLRLNEVYPQLPERKTADDQTDYRAELTRMRAEYADEL